MDSTPKTVCITGASRGIGHGFARAYLAAGATVFAAARDTASEGVQALSRDYPETCVPVGMDVGERASVAAGAERIRASTDRLDLLINNAGMALPPTESRIEDIYENDVAGVFNVNTLGPLRVSQQLIQLLRNGHDPKVVMISSSAGSIAGQGGGRGVPYCVSKAALNMLTRLLYFHFRDDGIATVALHPGWVRTDMGGAGAITVDDSVAGMMEVIDQLTTGSPLYVDYQGRPMEW